MPGLTAEHGTELRAHPERPHHAGDPDALPADVDVELVVLVHVVFDRHREQRRRCEDTQRLGFVVLYIRVGRHPGMIADSAGHRCPRSPGIRFGSAELQPIPLSPWVYANGPSNVVVTRRASRVSSRRRSGTSHRTGGVGRVTMNASTATRSSSRAMSTRRVASFSALRRTAARQA